MLVDALGGGDGGSEEGVDGRRREGGKRGWMGEEGKGRTSSAGALSFVRVEVGESILPRGEFERG